MFLKNYQTDVFWHAELKYDDSLEVQKAVFEL